MTKTQTISLAGLAALALLLPTGGAHAATYVKQGPGGDLLGNAYLTSGTIGDPLSEIDGVFSTPSATSIQAIPDLFQIDLTGLAPFSATTVGTNGSVYDTQLFLFNSLGNGIEFNDDDPSQLLPGGIQLGAGATLPPIMLSAGIYYLGIGVEGTAPQSTTGGTSSNIFPYPLTDGSSFTAVDGPTGPGGAGKLSNWSITSDDAETGSYSILLTGAAIAVPEASPVALLGLSGLLLAVVLRRRRAASPA